MSLARLGALAAVLTAAGLALPTHHATPRTPTATTAAHAPSSAGAGLDAATTGATRETCTSQASFARWSPQRRAAQLVPLNAGERHLPAVRAVAAGADTVLFDVHRPVAETRRVVASIVAAERAGRLPPARVAAADAAVLAAKGRPLCPAR